MLGTVLANTIVWVVVVVALTIVISLGVAQFLTKDFCGRKVVRWAIIVPWAASLVITAKTFVDDLRLLLRHAEPGPVQGAVIGTPIDFLGNDAWIDGRR